jgi:putative hydrolase of the HAD superfamily
MIKVISFDLDGTLMKNTFADLVWLEGLPKVYAQEKDINFKKAKSYIHQEYEKIGDHKVEWYDLQYWFNRFDLKGSWRDLLEQYKYAIEPYPEVSGVLRRFNKKFNLIITSNAKREFIEIELKETNLRAYFTRLFSSTSDFHKVKKTSDFYTLIYQNLKIDPSEMIHIGDNEKFDYTIPKSIGINTFYLNRKKTNSGEYIVFNLEEFEEKIKILYFTY